MQRQNSVVRVKVFYLHHSRKDLYLAPLWPWDKLIFFILKIRRNNELRWWIIWCPKACFTKNCSSTFLPRLHVYVVMFKSWNCMPVTLVLNLLRGCILLTAVLSWRFKREQKWGWGTNTGNQPLYVAMQGADAHCWHGAWWDFFLYFNCTLLSMIQMCIMKKIKCA